jgi:hypothetical protein
MPFLPPPPHLHVLHLRIILPQPRSSQHIPQGYPTPGGIADGAALPRQPTDRLDCMSGRCERADMGV